MSVPLVVALVCTALLMGRFVREFSDLRSKNPWIAWVGVVCFGLAAFIAFNSPQLGPWKLVLSGLFTGIASGLALLDFPDTEHHSGLGAPIGLVAIVLGIFSIYSITFYIVFADFSQ